MDKIFPTKIKIEKGIMPCRKCRDVITDIVKGNTALLIERVFKLPVEKCEYTEERIRICRACEKSTWYTKQEFALYVITRLGKIVDNLNDLSRLPDMPVGSSWNKRKHLFCRKCKCYIDAKARIERSKCDLGKWVA